MIRFAHFILLVLISLWSGCKAQEIPLPLGIAKSASTENQQSTTPSSSPPWPYVGYAGAALVGIGLPSVLVYKYTDLPSKLKNILTSFFFSPPQLSSLGDAPEHTEFVVKTGYYNIILLHHLLPSLVQGLFDAKRIPKHLALDYTQMLNQYSHVITSAQGTSFVKLENTIKIQLKEIEDRCLFQPSMDCLQNHTVDALIPQWEADTTEILRPLLAFLHQNGFDKEEQALQNVQSNLWKKDEQALYQSLLALKSVVTFHQKPTESQQQEAKQHLKDASTIFAGLVYDSSFSADPALQTITSQFESLGTTPIHPTALFELRKSILAFLTGPISQQIHINEEDMDLTLFLEELYAFDLFKLELFGLGFETNIEFFYWEDRKKTYFRFFMPLGDAPVHKEFVVRTRYYNIILFEHLIENLLHTLSDKQQISESQSLQMLSQYSTKIASGTGTLGLHDLARSIQKKELPDHEFNYPTSLSISTKLQQWQHDTKQILQPLITFLHTNGLKEEEKAIQNVQDCLWQENEQQLYQSLMALKNLSKRQQEPTHTQKEEAIQHLKDTSTILAKLIQDSALSKEPALQHIAARVQRLPTMPQSPPTLFALRKSILVFLKDHISPSLTDKDIQLIFFLEELYAFDLFKLELFDLGSRIYEDQFLFEERKKGYRDLFHST